MHTPIAHDAPGPSGRGRPVLAEMKLRILSKMRDNGA